MRTHANAHTGAHRHTSTISCAAPAVLPAVTARTGSPPATALRSFLPFLFRCLVAMDDVHEQLGNPVLWFVQALACHAGLGHDWIYLTLVAVPVGLGIDFLSAVWPSPTPG